MSLFTRSLLALTALAFVSLSSTACDDIEDAGFSVPVTVTLPEAIPIAMPSSEVIASIDSVDGTRVVPMCDGDGSLAACIPFVHLSNADLLALDETGTLAGYGDRINAVEILEIHSIIEENTLPVAVRPIEIRIGDQGDTFAQSLIAGETSAYEQGATGELQGTIVPENQIDIGESLGSLQFAVGMGTSLAIPDGTVGQTGQTSVRIQLRLSVHVSPLVGL